MKVGIEASLEAASEAASGAASEAASEAWVAAEVGVAVDYSILEYTLDNKLWGSLLGMEVVAGQEEERVPPLEGEEALLLAVGEEGNNSQPAGIERGME